MGETAPTLLFVVMPLLIATGAAAVTAVILQARSEVAVACQRERIAEMRAILAAEQRHVHDRVRAAEEIARRQALDEVISDIRVEDRQFSRGKSVVVQERVCFRNIPLTGWVEQEVARQLESAPDVRALPPPRRLIYP